MRELRTIVANHQDWFFAIPMTEAADLIERELVQPEPETKPEPAPGQRLRIRIVKKTYIRMYVMTARPGYHDNDLLRLPEVIRETSLGRSTIYKMMAAKEFPLAFQISRGMIRWRWSEIREWKESRPRVQRV